MKDFRSIEASELRKELSPRTDEEFELVVERLKNEGLLYQDGDFFISIHY